MATIQSRKSHGHKYWYIVESQRFNGKPRPITLAYLGKAGDLLEKLKNTTKNLKLKSYVHGGIAALLNIADSLDVCNIINKHVKSPRGYTSQKPIRNHLTAGATLLLAAIGRTCKPTSKDSWKTWAKTTSLPYLIKHSLEKIDSQHFWDLMDVIPAEAISKIESELIRKATSICKFSADTLFYDTTNFFTYIHTANERCTIAKRGRNKQKRKDLRQIGLALAVTKKERFPLFHLTYEGNKHDSKIFTQLIIQIKERLREIGFSKEAHTIVFDRGNNSRKNLELLKENDFYYVGALVPFQHKKLVSEVLQYFEDNPQEKIYRDKKKIWGENRTIVVFISDNLRAGQLSWLHNSLNKIKMGFSSLEKTLSKKKLSKDEINMRVKLLTKGYRSLINYQITELDNKKFQISYSVNEEVLMNMEEKAGFRILMTNRHQWTNDEIVETYNGQANIERSFRDLKNPSYLAVRPQFHWTDQKIKVHFFICILGYLLSTILAHKIHEATSYKGSIASLISQLNNVRLGTILETKKVQGKLKAIYQLEEMTKAERSLIETLNIENLHLKRPRLSGFRVYI